MSLTVHKLGLSLLRRIGVLSYDPAQNAGNQNRRGLCDGDLEEVLIAINGAMEECFSLGPVELSQQEQAGVLWEPTSITFDVTQYSAVIANATGWEARMQGCTVRVPGDTRDNQILSATKLLRPFMGPTAAATSVTVFGDAVPLPSIVLTVLAPVSIPEGELVPGIPQCFEGSAGQPKHWNVETRNIDGNAFTQRFLRVAPLPSRAYSLTYDAKVKPPTFAQTDFYSGTSYAVDPGTVIPFDWAESTLLPVALQRFSAHPAFDHPEVIAEVARQAELAKRVFAESAKPMTAPRKAHYRWRV